jgi:hypothetical protein
MRNNNNCLGTKKKEEKLCPIEIIAWNKKEKRLCPIEIMSHENNNNFWNKKN